MSLPSGTRSFPSNLVMTHSSGLQQMYLAAGHVITSRELLGVEQNANASRLQLSFFLMHNNKFT